MQSNLSAEEQLKLKKERYSKVYAKREVTAERHANMKCRVYELKLQQNKFNQLQTEFLNRIFAEAKWFYNDCIAQENIFKHDNNIKEVNVMLKKATETEQAVYETRELKHLSSQSKQDLHVRIKTSIKALSTKKKKGKSKEVGRLKFKSEVSSIPLRQHGNSYALDLTHDLLRLAGCKKKFKVAGMDQFSSSGVANVEFANANLIKKASGYYLKVTTYQDKSRAFRKAPVEVVGIDFGIKDDLVLSNGIKFKTKFEIPDELKRKQKLLSRKVKGSKNYQKQQIKLQKSYNKLTNKKIDTKNKIISYLKNNYSHIGIQNENIKGWHAGLFGRQIQQSILGGLISEIKNLPQTSTIDRFFPSTKLCRKCGSLREMKLSDRTYECECGHVEDRDVNASNNILLESLNLRYEPTEHRFTTVEFNTTALEKLRYSLPSNVSIDYEAGRYNSLELC